MLDQPAYAKIIKFEKNSKGQKVSLQMKYKVDILRKFSIELPTEVTNCIKPICQCAGKLDLPVTLQKGNIYELGVMTKGAKGFEGNGKAFDATFDRRLKIMFADSTADADTDIKPGPTIFMSINSDNSTFGNFFEKKVGHWLYLKAVQKQVDLVEEVEKREKK